jgi:hypothetical protein
VKEEHRSRGGQALPTVTRLLCELALRGAEDLVGLTGRILKRLQEVAGELKLSISPRTLSHALQLLLATKTCLMVREGHTWTIRLEELSDPWSQLHREFLKETPRACRPARAAETTAAAEATVDEVRQHEEGAADAADAAAAVDSDATNSEASTMTDETADDETMSVASTISDDAAATEADPLEAPATPVIIAPEAPAADPPEAPAAPAGGYSSTRPPVLAVVATAAGNLSATPTTPSSPAAPTSAAEERMTLLEAAVREGLEEIQLLRDTLRAALVAAAAPVNDPRPQNVSEPPLAPITPPPPPPRRPHSP